MNKQGYQSHKGGKRTNGGASNSNYGYQGSYHKSGYGNQENYNPTGQGYQRQEGNASRPNKEYNKDYGRDYSNKDYGYSRKDAEPRTQGGYRPEHRPETQQRNDRPNYSNQSMKIQAQPFTPKPQSHEYSPKYEEEKGDQMKESFGRPAQVTPFGMKPIASAHSLQQHQQKAMYENRNPESGGRAVVPVKCGQSVNLVSNQYILRVGASVNVYQYALEITPMHVWDANLVHRVMKLKRTALERALGPHVCSGKSVYTLAEIDTDLVFKTGKIQGEEYTISISVDTCSVVNLNSNFSNKENDVKQQIINVIIKDAFRSTDLR
jgi:hypothetical protein